MSGVKRVRRTRRLVAMAPGDSGRMLPAQRRRCALDLHAAFGRAEHFDGLGGAVHAQRQEDLLHDRHGLFQHQGR
jgi:hypothetical protein